MSDNVTKRNRRVEDGPCVKRNRHLGRDIIVVLSVAGGILLLAAAFLAIATAWLTPRRLEEIINREASRYTRAHVTVHNPRFTFWSSFPELCIDIDSLTVVSRSLDELPAKERQALPADAARLLSAGRTSAQLNIRSLFGKEIKLGDISVDSLDLNLLKADSATANWDIFPRVKSKGVPHITARSVRLTHPLPIRYRDIQANTDAMIAPATVSLRGADTADTYRLTAGGKASATVNGKKYLDSFPFMLHGKVALCFSPFRLKTKDYTIRAGNTRSRLDADMTLEKNVTIHSLGYRLEEFDTESLLRQLPSDLIPFMDGLRPELRLGAEALLSRPYTPGEGRLPSFTATVHVPRGRLLFNNIRERKYDLTDIAIDSRLVFDGVSPAASVLYVPMARVKGAGTDLRVSGKVCSLIDNPSVTADIRGKALLPRLAAIIPSLQGLDISGTVATDLGVRFRVADMKAMALHRIQAAGNVALRDFGAGEASMLGRLSGNDLRVRFKAASPLIAAGNVSGSLLDCDIDADHLTVDAGNVKGQVEGLRLSTRRTGMTADASGHYPVNLHLKATSLYLSDPTDTVRLRVNDAEFRGSLLATAQGKVSADGLSARVKGTSASYSHGATSMSVNALDVTMNAARRARLLPVADYRSPAAWNADSYTARFARSMPRTLNPSLPETARNLLAAWEAGLEMRCAYGTLHTPGYPAANRFSDVHISAGTDSVTVHSLSLRSGRTALHLSGSAWNLRQFLASATPAPLRMRLIADIDTLDINDIAYAYFQGVANIHGKEAVTRMLADTTIHPGDSVAIMIPRNIYADIMASAARTRYTDIVIDRMRGPIHVADGRVKIDSLHIRTGFANAVASAIYDTRDMQDMGLGLWFDVADLDVARFFGNFPSILAKAPQLENLSGTVAFNASFNAGLFPTMYMLTPSICADVNLKAIDLSLRKRGVIRTVAHLMMLHGDKPVKIKDINLHASIRDNTVSVDPFLLAFGDYKLKIGGLNNFHGDMYYHLGVLDWPLKARFGVNLTGNFGHPEVSLGGSRWKSIHASELANGIMTADNINLSSKLRHGFIEFLGKAAPYAASYATEVP